MKAIKIGCKTAGFQYGDTAEIGKGEGKISLEDAQALVNSGLAKEMQVVVSGTNENAKLIEANKVLADENAKLKSDIETLHNFVAEAINLAKGQIPAGYEKV